LEFQEKSDPDMPKKQRKHTEAEFNELSKSRSKEEKT